MTSLVSDEVIPIERMRATVPPVPATETFTTVNV